MIKFNDIPSFEKTDVFILIGRDRAGVLSILPEDKPVFHAHVEVPENKKPSTIKPYIAFAGLGRPEKFYHLLQSLSLNIAAWHPYPDHYPYTAEDLRKLALEAERKDAALITTEKDFQRLPENAEGLEIHTLPIELVWENESAIVDFLKSRLAP